MKIILTGIDKDEIFDWKMIAFILGGCAIITFVSIITLAYLVLTTI